MGKFPPFLDKSVHTERLTIAILENDFAEFTRLDDVINSIPGRSVPPDYLRHRFGKTHGWEAFVRGTRHRWLKWLRKAPLCEADKLVWSLALYESLGVPVVDH